MSDSLRAVTRGRLHEATVQRSTSRPHDDEQGAHRQHGRKTHSDTCSHPPAGSLHQLPHCKIPGAGSSCWAATFPPTWQSLSPHQCTRQGTPACSATAAYDGERWEDENMARCSRPAYQKAAWLEGETFLRMRSLLPDLTHKAILFLASEKCHVGEPRHMGLEYSDRQNRRQ